MTFGRPTHSLRARRILLPLLLIAIAAGAALAEDQNRARNSPTTIAPLLADLHSSDWQRRRDAARALAGIQPLPPEAIQALADSLKISDSSRAVEQYAVEALTKQGAPSIPALTQLLSLTGNKDAQTRQAAVAALGGMAGWEPAAWPPLIGAFTDDFVREGAAIKVAKGGVFVIALLRKALKDDDPRVRLGAAIALRTIGPPAKVALPDLVIALNDKSILRVHGFEAPAVRYQAALAIVSIDPKQELVVPALVEALADRNSFTRVSAAEALGKMGTIAEAAVPNLERALATDSDGVVRIFAAHSLGQINGSTACVVLTRVLKTDKDASVRARAARVIATLGPTCLRAIPALVDALAERSSSASDALAILGKPAVPALTEALKSPDLYVRESAVKALAAMKPLSDEAVRALTLALNDKSFKVSSEAARTLQDAVGEAGRAALAEQDREERYYAELAKLDTKPYTRGQIAANIPPDNDHKFPLELEYFYPIYVPGHEPYLLISLHRGKDRGERLIFWKNAPDGKYRQIKVIETDEELGPDNFGIPKTFTAKVQQEDIRDMRQQLFIDIPRYAWRNQSHQVFVFADGDLAPVEIESPEEWYKDKLRPGETTWDGAANSFSDGKLEFRFAIRSGNDNHASPGGGIVTGTYKVIKQVCDNSPTAIADVPLDLPPSVNVVEGKNASPKVRLPTRWSSIRPNENRCRTLGSHDRPSLFALPPRRTAG